VPDTTPEGGESRFPVLVIMIMIVAGAVPVIVPLLVPHSSRMTRKAHCSTSTPATRTRLQMARTTAGQRSCWATCQRPY
jgi:hypothetical protein